MNRFTLSSFPGQSPTSDRVTEVVMKTSRMVFCVSFILSLILVFSTVERVEAQPSPADTIRFLEQSTFGPTTDLIARTQQLGFETALAEQAAAPMTDYPDLPV